MRSRRSAIFLSSNKATFIPLNKFGLRGSQSDERKRALAATRALMAVSSDAIGSHMIVFKDCGYDIRQLIVDSSEDKFRILNTAGTSKSKKLNGEKKCWKNMLEVCAG